MQDKRVFRNPNAWSMLSYSDISRITSLPLQAAFYPVDDLTA
jgi:hypothetical protein